jgi:hypothetical protein
MAGLVPAIHAFFCKAAKKDVDARREAGHDVQQLRDSGFARFTRAPE